MHVVSIKLQLKKTFRLSLRRFFNILRLVTQRSAYGAHALYSSLKPKKHFAKEIRIIVRLVIAQENMFKLMSVFFLCVHVYT